MQTMTMEAVATLEPPKKKINSKEMIEKLEARIKELENSYSKKFDEIKEQYGPGIVTYRDLIKEHVDRLNSLIDSTNFFENVIFDPEKVKDELKKAAAVDNEVLVRITGIDNQAFKEYLLGVEAALASVMEPTAHLLNERSETLRDMEPVYFDESTGTLKEKLKMLGKMESQIKNIEKNNPRDRIVTTYYQECHETKKRIDELEKRYEAMKKITEEPLYYPVQIMWGREIETVIYAFSKDPSIYEKIFDRAVMRALKESNAEKIMQGNSSRFRRYTNFQRNNQNIAELIKKELEKPEYEELRRANVVPKFYEVAANGEGLLSKKHPDGKLYSTKEIAEELNIGWSSVKNWVYTENRDLMQYSVKEGRLLFFTKEGLEKIREYMQQKKLSKRQPKPPKKINKTDKMVDMYHSGLTIEQIAEQLKVGNTTVWRNLKKSGLITWYRIVREFDTLEKIKNAQFGEFPVYPKQGIRDEMLLEMIDNLKELENIKYLGLEGPNFGSYIEIADAVSVDRKNSVIAENNKRAYRMMESIVKNSGRIEGGEIFQDLNVFYGDLSNAVDCHKEKGFNFVNLDYMGSFSKEKMQTMGKLFENNMLMDNAVLYITLSNHERDKERLKRGSSNLPDEFKKGFGTDDQYKIVGDYLRNLAGMTGYSIDEINCREYKSKKTPMLFMSFKVEKNGAENGKTKKTNI